MKALITGSRGFVGGYLRQELENHGYDVVGLDLNADKQTIKANLLNAEETSTAVKAIMPEAVFHLAGQADVGKSWSIPQKTFEINVIGAVNLMEAVRTTCPTARVLLVGSSDQYGNLGDQGVSVSETLEMKPQTPYAVSKKAQEEIAGVYVRTYGMNICMTRSFNHGGAGQQTGFLIPDIASGIVKVERGLAEKLLIGNLSAHRDFTHVRDVVRAYRLITERGLPGEVYNVGSGITHSVKDILDKLLAMSTCPIPVEQDPTKMRPSDTPIICCDNHKLCAHTGWVQEQIFESILEDTLNFFRNN